MTEEQRGEWLRFIKAAALDSRTLLKMIKGESLNVPTRTRIELAAKQARIDLGAIRPVGEEFCEE